MAEDFEQMIAMMQTTVPWAVPMLRCCYDCDVGLAIIRPTTHVFWPPPDVDARPLVVLVGATSAAAADGPAAFRVYRVLGPKLPDITRCAPAASPAPSTPLLASRRLSAARQRLEHVFAPARKVPG